MGAQASHAGVGVVGELAVVVVVVVVVVGCLKGVLRRKVQSVQCYNTPKTRAHFGF